MGTAQSVANAEAQAKKFSRGALVPQALVSDWLKGATKLKGVTYLKGKGKKARWRREEAYHLTRRQAMSRSFRLIVKSHRTKEQALHPSDKDKTRTKSFVNTRVLSHEMYTELLSR